MKRKVQLLAEGKQNIENWDSMTNFWKSENSTWCTLRDDPCRKWCMENPILFFFEKKKRFPCERHTLTHWSLTDIFFENHRILSQSEDSNCMWTQSDIFTVCSHKFYSLLIEKEICDCQDVLVKLQCIYVCLSSGDLFIFSVTVSSFFLYFFVIRTSVLSLNLLLRLQ